MPTLRCTLTLLASLACVPPSTGQVPSRPGPQQAEAALDAFAKVEHLAEPARLSAIHGLGRFGSPAIDRLLVAELKRAQTLGYKEAVIRAIGRQPRDGVIPLLLVYLDDPLASSAMRYTAAQSIGGQGEPAIPVLVQRLAALPRPTSGRRILSGPLFGGLSRVGTPAAFDAIVEAGRRGPPADRQTALENLRQAPKSTAVTAFRLECLDDKSQLVRVKALVQLAAEPHPKVEAAALALHKSLDGKPASAYLAAQLAEVFVQILTPQTFEAFLITAAGAYQRLDSILKPIAAKVDTVPGLVDWLLTKGLERRVPTERLVAMRLLALATDPRVAEAIEKLVGSREPGMALMAIHALARRLDRRAVPTLRRALKSKDETRQVAALEALHALLAAEPEWRDELISVFRSARLRPRILALDLLAGMQASDLLPEVHRLFTHKSWPLRAAAYDFCRVVRSLDSVSPLIERLDAEKGRLREDCLDALKAITSYRLFDSARWRSWWKESRPTFVMPTLAQVSPPKRQGRAPSTVSSFFDIPLVSTRVAFVIDISGSMSAGMATVSSSGKVSRTRIDAAKRQLTRVVGELQTTSLFNVVYFETKVQAFAKAARKATRSTKAEALGFVQRLRATGGTNIHDALELAFADDDIDTIYLLSDGSPSAGKITDATQLADAVASWNKVRRIRIHTIAIGSQSKLMERLAADSGGVHSHVR